MNHVLEHVVNLRRFLGHAGRILAPGGLVFVQVPYHLGLIPRLMADHWLAWLPSQHVWHFTPASLSYVFREATGLAVLQTKTRGAIEPKKWPGLKGAAKGTLQWFSQRVGWGDEIEAVFGR